jgi:hypothetical protein
MGSDVMRGLAGGGVCGAAFFDVCGERLGFPSLSVVLMVSSVGGS